MIKNINDIDFSKAAKRKSIKQPKPYINLPVTDDTSENRAILEQARMDWDALSNFRAKRKRARNYELGDQWGDQMYDPDTKTYMTEEDYIKSQGKVPLKQNFIRSFVKTIVGQFRNNKTQTIIAARARENEDASEMISNAIEAVQDFNNTKELDARLLEEFCISGAPIQKITYKYIPTLRRQDVYIENTNPNRISFNTDIEDLRGNDIRRITEIIDSPIDDIIEAFAKSPGDEEKIKDWYAGEVSTPEMNYQGPDKTNIDNISFYQPPLGKCRIFCCWYRKIEWRLYVHDPLDASYKWVESKHKKLLESYNAERAQKAIDNGLDPEGYLLDITPKKETFWYVKFLTERGHCLWEGESPYLDKGHPYAIFLYPLLDGEIRGFVEDVIDQQRYINRNITLLDSIIGASAKGLLLVPETCVPEDMSPEEFSNQWTKVNGVIFYKVKSGFENLVPEQISANSTGVGIQELIAFQMQYLQDTSGVHGAMQGKAPTSGTPASLYAQESQNASINILDFMSSFYYFLKRRDEKVLNCILKFYKGKRYLAIAGKSFTNEAKEFDASRVNSEVGYDLKVIQGNDTPLFRMRNEDMLLSLLDKQVIDGELYLEFSNLPFSDKLLEAIKKRKEAMAAGQPAPPIDPNLVNQAQQGANPQAVGLLNQAMGQS
jgi:hypothetical protein